MKNEALMLKTLHHLLWVTDELRQPYLRDRETFNTLSKDLSETLKNIHQQEEKMKEIKIEKVRKESVNLYYYGEKGKRIKVVDINCFIDSWKKCFKIGDKRTIAEICGGRVKTKEEKHWFNVGCFELVRPVK